MAHRSPLYFKGAQDAQMIPCGTILDCKGNPLFSKMTRTSVTSGATYDVLLSDFYIGVNVTNDIDLNFPPAADWSGRYFIIKDEGGNSGAYRIRLVPDGSETIDGQSEYKMSIAFQSIHVYSNGTNIFII